MQRVLEKIAKIHKEAGRGKFPAAEGHKRMCFFLELLGNPQDKVRSIHIAGTSGKGSTAVMIESLCRAHGLKTGLHLSPHLLDPRERMQLDGAWISEETFSEIFQCLEDALESMKDYPFGPPTEFEMYVAMAFVLFARSQVDIAIIETGLGGLWDATNCITREDKVICITSLSLDHKHVLGKTLKEIAYHKIMIARQGAQVFYMAQDPVLDIYVQEVAQGQGAEFHLLSEHQTYVLKPSLQGVLLLSEQEFYEVGLHGTYQLRNGVLALETVRYALQRFFHIWNPKKAKEALQTLQFPGRFHIIQRPDKRILIDGAHNAQKMKEFLLHLSSVFPKDTYSFILCIKKSKEYLELFHMILPYAYRIYLTRSTEYPERYVDWSSESEIEKLSQKVVLSENIECAYRSALQDGSTIVVATGSLSQLKNYLELEKIL